MQFLTTIFRNLMKLHKIKIYFKAPKKNNILIFDKERIFFLKDIIKKENIQTLDIRLETLNLSILFNSFFKTGFKGLAKEYIKNYIIAVRPKLILTFSDYNPTFFILKDLVTSFRFKTLAVQSSLRTNIHLKAFKKNKIKYYCDYFFVISKESENLFSKYVKSKYFINGSFLNNAEKILNYKNKKKKIIFISQFKVPEYGITRGFFMEKKLVTYLKKYCQDNNYSFNIAVRPNITTNLLDLKKNTTVYLKYFKNINKKNIVGERFKNNNYKNLDKSDLVIFLNSTLGLEALSRGKKVLGFPHFPICKNQYTEFFIAKLTKYSLFEKKLDLIIKMSQNDWTKKTGKSKLKYIYDYNNSQFRRILKSNIN